MNKEKEELINKCWRIKTIAISLFVSVIFYSIGVVMTINEYVILGLLGLCIFYGLIFLFNMVD